MKCDYCGGRGSKFITDRVVQGQDYGLETCGHYEKCPQCNGTGVIPDTEAPTCASCGLFMVKYGYHFHCTNCGETTG